MYEKASEVIMNNELRIENAIMKIKHDININKRCLQEETIPAVKRMLELAIQFDEELLEILESKGE